MATKKTSSRKRRSGASRRPTIRGRILNCIESKDQFDDWTLDQAVESGLIARDVRIPGEFDLRESWWKIRNQGETGACVGFATADVLRWHFATAGRIEKHVLLSPRFIWMANKETDEYVTYPTTFIEKAGTRTKEALGVARKFGAVRESTLPMDGGLYPGSMESFYTAAAALRIASYRNLARDNLDDWRFWIATQGPLLTRLDVDETWKQAKRTKGKLRKYDPLLVYGGHAVALVGYTRSHFIVRNSWGVGWGDRGFAYASRSYAKRAFTEVYGVML